MIDKGEPHATKTMGMAGQQQIDQSYFFYNILHPSSRTQCDNCRKDISKTTSVLFLDGDNYMDFCFSCFGKVKCYEGDYHIANKLDFPVLDQDWTAREELLMFEGLQTHGYGNWADIAHFIGTGKTRQQVEDHYEHIYLCDSSFLPKDIVLSKRNQEGILVQVETRIQQERKKVTQLRPQTISHIPANVTSRKGRASANAATQPNKQHTNPSEVVGFMSRRGDFEIQYDNDAELLLADMQFNDDDTQQEKAMKFRLIDIYNHKLTERINRKEFVISRRLLDIREQMRLDKTRTKEEKEIYNLMKVVARFNTPEDHERLVQNIIKEKQLRQRIAELKQLQTRGFRTLADVQQELQGKKKRDDKSKKRDDYLTTDKNTRRVPRKEQGSERSDKKVLYVSKEEEELCRKLNMTFRQYTNIKEIILREAIKLGVLVKDKTISKLTLPKRSADAIFDFLVQQEGLVEQKVQKMQNEA